MSAAVQFDFVDQQVLVTGGASGLGLAIAQAFGRAGAEVVVLDLGAERVERAVDALRDEGVRARGTAADVCEAEALSAALDSLVGRDAAPDIVVANAGIYPNRPFLEIDEAEWDRVVDTNLKGVFLTCQLAARRMVRAGRTGQLLTIASGAANAAIWGWSHYCASKAAVVMLTRAMALELGEHGIRANCLLPGYVEVGEGGRHLDEAYRRAASAANPLGRIATPADVARAALLLASPLSAHVNGVALAVDAGASAGRLGVRPRTR